MDLLDIPENPLPAPATVSEVTTRDGLVLRTARWEPGGGRRLGTVCLLQGRAEFIEKYFEVVSELRQRGFAVLAFDWRGQGGSAREIGDPRKGYVRRFADYRLDLEAVQAQILRPVMPRPHFALAHSMGGAIALLAAADGKLPFERLVSTAPMIELSIIRSLNAARRLARTLNLIGMGRSLVPGGGRASIMTLPFAGNRLSSDPQRYARNAAAATAAGSGAIGAPTIAWLDAAFRVMGQLQDPRFPLQVRVPTLLFGAGADPVCATAAIERFGARLKAGHAIVIPGSRHEILMERDQIREEFWAAIDAFIPGSMDYAPKASAAKEGEGGLVNAAIAGGDH